MYGQYALEILQFSTDFDLILLDIKLPRLDGFHTLGILKATDSVKQLPVVILTTVRDREAVDKTQKLGMYKVLNKPENYH